MKVPFHIVQARREKLAQLIEQHRYLPVKELCLRLGVSEATARRDLAALVQEKRITRTYGGALPEFNERFPSFRERQSHAAKGKARIARAAIAYVQPGQTCFFDSGTTICALAEEFRSQPITPLKVVTSNIPIGEMLAAIPGVEVFQIAGQLLHRQSTLLDEAARRSLEFWDFDIAFLSAEAMDSRGLWNSQASIVDQQNVVRRRSRRVVFCLDASKLNRHAPHFLLPWDQVDVLLTDAPLDKLTDSGIPLLERQYVPAERTTSRSHVDRSASEDESRPPAGEGDMPVHIL